MLPTDQPKLFALVNEVLCAYVKPPSPQELEAWWRTCRPYAVPDVERALKEHQADVEDGKRAPRPIDVKRRVLAPKPMEQRFTQSDRDPTLAELHAYWRQRDEYGFKCANSPSVIRTAHAIALRHGNKPWGGTYAEKTLEDLA